MVHVSGDSILGVKWRVFRGLEIFSIVVSAWLLLAFIEVVPVEVLALVAAATAPPDVLLLVLRRLIERRGGPDLSGDGGFFVGLNALRREMLL